MAAATRAQLRDIVRKAGPQYDVTPAAFDELAAIDLADSPADRGKPENERGGHVRRQIRAVLEKYHPTDPIISPQVWYAYQALRGS